MKSFKEFLFNTKKKYNFASDPMFGNDVKLFNLSVKKVNDSWKNDKNYYIQPNGVGGIGKRYNRFKEFLNSDPDVIYAPVVHIDEDGNIHFDNGRHRFAVFRDIGYKTLPISISKQSIKNAQKFNYIGK